MADATYSVAGRRTGARSMADEVAEFLQMYRALTPDARSAIHQILRPDIISELTEVETHNAIKSHSTGKSVEGDNQPVTGNGRKR